MACAFSSRPTPACLRACSRPMRGRLTSLRSQKGEGTGRAIRTSRPASGARSRIAARASPSSIWRAGPWARCSRLRMSAVGAGSPSSHLSRRRLPVSWSTPASAGSITVRSSINRSSGSSFSAIRAAASALSRRICRQRPRRSCVTRSLRRGALDDRLSCRAASQRCHPSWSTTCASRASTAPCLSRFRPTPRGSMTQGWSSGWWTLASQRRSCRCMRARPRSPIA